MTAPDSAATPTSVSHAYELAFLLDNKRFFWPGLSCLCARAQCPAGPRTRSGDPLHHRHVGKPLYRLEGDGVLAGLFFVGLPLMLVFLVHDWRVLGVLFAGAMFVWPFWRIVQNNKPRSYDPRNPSGELME